LPYDRLGKVGVSKADYMICKAFGVGLIHGRASVIRFSERLAPDPPLASRYLVQDNPDLLPIGPEYVHKGLGDFGDDLFLLRVVGPAAAEVDVHKWHARILEVR